MRFVGVGLIVFSCGMMGIIVANSYDKRVQNLLQLISFLQFLESEINFARTTLPEIIEKQKSEFRGVVHDFLVALDVALKEELGTNFYEIWVQGTTCLEKGGFSSQVLSDLLDLGKVLGTSDVTEQIKHLRLTLIRLEEALETARLDQEKHTRLWQYLGFSAGLLIVLLLL